MMGLWRAMLTMLNVLKLFFCITALNVVLFLLWRYAFCKEENCDDKMYKADIALIISFSITTLLFIIGLMYLFIDALF